MDDFTLAEALFVIRWPNGLECSCSGREFYHLRSRPRVWQCASCGSPHSVTAGTIMHRTRLPLAHWFGAVEGLLDEWWGISARALAGKLGIGVETAWQLLHRVRAAVSEDGHLLDGTCQQYAHVLPCRQPRHEEHIEVVSLCDEAGHARMLGGTPSIDRTLGLEGLERVEMVCGYLNRESPTYCRPPKQPTDPATRATVFRDTARVEQGTVWQPAERLLSIFKRRVMSTHHAVSGRWFDRYAREVAFLWTRWSDGSRLVVPADAVTQVLGRCLRAARRTFLDMRPPWEAPPPRPAQP